MPSPPPPQSARLLGADGADGASAEKRGARRPWRWRDVFSAITAFSALWLALLATVLVVGGIVGGIELGAKVQEHVAWARPYLSSVWPHVQRHSGTFDALFEAATSPETLALTARGVEVARHTLTLAELFYGTSPEETLPLAMARAAAWEKRAEALYNDRRLVLLSRLVEQGAEIAETRAGALFSDVLELSNITHAFIQRQARRMRALEAALAD